MIERVRLIIFRPQQTWLAIKGESTGFADVLTHYLMPLAAIPAVCGMLGHAITGARFGFRAVVYRVPLHIAFIWAILYYITTIIGVYVTGIVINALAPSFHARQHTINAFKLAAYAYTPAAIAGVLKLSPALSFLVFLLSLYSVYLLYCGLPVMMEAPEDKIIVYLVLIIVVMIVVYLIIGAIPSAVVSAAWHPAA
jgi:hypothetical protein